MEVVLTGIDELVVRLERLAAYDPQPVLEAVADTYLQTLMSATPERTGAARGGWQAEPIPDGVALQNIVLHTKFLIEGTGKKRFAVVNDAWSGMYPNAALRAAWLRAPDVLAGEIEATLVAAIGALLA